MSTVPPLCRGSDLLIIDMRFSKGVCRGSSAMAVQIKPECCPSGRTNMKRNHLKNVLTNLFLSKDSALTRGFSAVARIGYFHFPREQRKGYVFSFFVVGDGFSNKRD